MSKEHIIRSSFDPNNPPPLTPKQKEMIRKLKELPDSEIDYSDISPLDVSRLRPAKSRRVPVNQE
jgi:hypothetical protein